VGSSSATPAMTSSITDKPQMNNIANNIVEHAKPINDSSNSTKINGTSNLPSSANTTTTTTSSNSTTTNGNISNNNTSDVNKENIPTQASNGQQQLRTTQKANAPNIPTKEDTKEFSQVTSTTSSSPVSNTGAPSANPVITSTSANQTGPKHNNIQQTIPQLLKSPSGSTDPSCLDPSSVIISTTGSTASNTSIPENSQVDQVQQQQPANTVMSTSSSSSSSNATTVGGGAASSASSGTTTSNSYRLSNFEANNDTTSQTTEPDQQLQKPTVVSTTSAKTNAPIAPTTGKLLIVEIISAVSEEFLTKLN